MKLKKKRETSKIYINFDNLFLIYLKPSLDFCVYIEMNMTNNVKTLNCLSLEYVYI